MIPLLLSLIMLASTPQPPTPGPFGAERVVLIVRDGAGNSLSGVAIDIAVMGPPDESWGSCTTDVKGECALALAAFEYVLAFKDWQGIPFSEVSSQNQGPVEEAPKGSGELLSEGFGLHIEPLGVPQTFLFVIARDTSGRLVPLWDNARSRDQSPDPYIAPQQQGTLTLGPLAAGPTATSPVVVSGYDSTVTPTQAATAQPTPPAGTAAGGLFGLLLCSGMAAAGAGLWWWDPLGLRQPKRSRRISRGLQ